MVPSAVVGKRGPLVLKPPRLGANLAKKSESPDETWYPTSPVLARGAALPVHCAVRSGLVAFMRYGFAAVDRARGSKTVSRRRAGPDGPGDGRPGRRHQGTEPCRSHARAALPQTWIEACRDQFLLSAFHRHHRRSPEIGGQSNLFAEWRGEA